MKPETVKFTKEVPIVDADGVAITVGSVLKHITDSDRGVVVRIVRAGDMGSVLDWVGDMHVKTGRGSTRCTNMYNQWRHIPHNEQTYEERHLVWLKSPFYHDKDSSVPRDEAIACSGIMALLPDNIVDDFGPFPDRIEVALEYLRDYLTGKEQHGHQTEIRINESLIVTRQDVIDGLRIALTGAEEAERAKDSTFVRWPDMHAMLDHIEQHGLPPKS